MKNTKTNKILVSILCFAIVATLSATILATTDPFNGISPNATSNMTNSTYSIGNNILGIIQTVGVILSVGILMVLGIKYMMGSAEEKAEYKKTFIPYIIGAVLLFAASALAKIVYTWVQDFNI